MDNTHQHEAQAQAEKAKTDYQAATEKMGKQDVEKAKAAGKTTAACAAISRSVALRQCASGQYLRRCGEPDSRLRHEGSLYGIRAKTNAGRAYEYAQLFPFMIEQWRKRVEAG